MKEIIEQLKNRGILKDISKTEKLDILDKTAAVYTGFDPTAQSLHLGNYIHIVNLLRFKNAGYRAIALVGGATGMVGDPSFRDDERKEMSNNTLLTNKQHIKNQLESFGLEVIDNYDFYKNLGFLDFLKNNGKIINVNYMLAKESVKQRLKNGMSFTEFSYQLIQGYDFETLYRNQNVCVQLGGSDQWGNITTGLEIIKTLHGDDHKAIGITCNLLTDSNGKKIGKSYGGGSLWLDANMTSPYSLYQFLINQRDDDVEKLLNWLTLLEQDKIKEIVAKSQDDKKSRLAQKELAFHTVEIIHSTEIAKQCREISQKLFENDILNLTNEDIKLLAGFLKVVEYKGETIIDLMVNNQIVGSRREFREFLNNKALSVDTQTIEDENQYISFNHFNQSYAFLKKGKKEFILLIKK
ncbi:tyrosine--tRNA ligase [[Mycoplasma] gypis]|uniref:Tyrosine--tRNA ligase n=1 Tax=[Mycoplasma] gypis TaxID=92404 RepID=A0ABZ2RNG6_9BACT|nr:tyrosine--tRNA ligase [[Mycoplasma] gypis]MBN0919358.1 tyrosine--tRNA ligase [[Mycoplasma] gypis]